MVGGIRTKGGETASMPAGDYFDRELTWVGTGIFPI